MNIIYKVVDMDIKDFAKIFIEVKQIFKIKFFLKQRTLMI